MGDKNANIDTVKVTAEINGVQRVEKMVKDYNVLDNKPQINNVELTGNKTLDELNIQPKGDYVIDSNYVHTDNNYSDDDKTKLDGLSNYTLPKASDSVLGGIMIGDNLNIDGEGKVSVIVTDGEDGATFTPSVDDSGNLSWTNDKSLPNPEPVNIKGPKGDTGEQGEQGEQGLPGATGPGVPTGGIIGQVLSKIGDGDYETGWKDIESGSSTGFKVLNPTAEEPIDLAAIQENGFYYCKCSSGEQYDAYLNKFSTGSYNGDFITLILGDNISYRLRLEITALTYISCRIYVGHNAPDNQKHYDSMISDIRPNENMNLSNNITYASVTSIKKLADAIGRSSESVQKLVPLSDLQTTDKSSLVAAINELKARIDALEGTGE